MRRAEQLALDIGPCCEKCAAPVDREQAEAGFMRCGECDPNGRHVAWAPGDGCGLCAAVEEEIVARASRGIRTAEPVGGVL